MLLLFLSAIIGSASAQSDDITLMGEIHPVYILEKPFSEQVITSDSEPLTVQVSDIAAEAERILIRFFITDLPESWKARINDSSRLYGSYLPAAELVLSDSSILTPSSASRYSFLEYNSRLVIGGLCIFDTEKAPRTFYLNFNQIPFDTKPLTEGFSKAVILSPAGGNTVRSGQPVSVTGNGLEFTLAAAAQTQELTMLQPAVRMENSSETLSKFGWISVTDSMTGNRFAVTRDHIYGFNLADDSLYAPAHAYYFKALFSDTPLEISMDHAYVVRFFKHPAEHSIDLSRAGNPVLLQEDGFYLRLTDIQADHEKSRIRLFLETGEKEIADISFQFEDTGGVTAPPVTCGLTADEMRFACDLYFSENVFPDPLLRFSIDAVEYKKEGPWVLRWVPVPMAAAKDATEPVPEPQFPAAPDPHISTGEQQPAIKAVMDRIGSLNRSLTEEEGWILERSHSVYQYAEGSQKDLIPVTEAEMYMTQYISENLYHINDSGITDRIITIIREPETNEIRSAQLQEDGSTLDLIHALYTRTGAPLRGEYSAYREFSEIIESSAVFLAEEPCTYDGKEMRCLSFSQSLNGIPGSSGSQEILFTVDPDDLLIRDEEIEYGRGALSLRKTINVPEKTDSLPDDTALLIGSIE